MKANANTIQNIVSRRIERLVDEFQIKNLIKEYGGCQQCGWCCKNERLTIFLGDIEKLGSLLKNEYVTRRDEISVTLEVPCPFLSNNRCSVYNKRSDVCKVYPFLFHYIKQISISFDCPLGRKVYEDILKFCNLNGVKIVGDESKTESMRLIDEFVRDEGLNSGDNHKSHIVNAPFELFREFLEWREKNKKRR